MAELTLTELRKDLFRLADQALETGEPVVVIRKGRRLLLKPEAGTPESPAAGWSRYLAWCEAGDEGQTAKGREDDLDTSTAETVDDGRVEWEAEWDAFDRHEAALDRLAAEERWEEFHTLVERGH
jgi:hypothetical protein